MSSGNITAFVSILFNRIKLNWLLKYNNELYNGIDGDYHYNNYSWDHRASAPSLNNEHECVTFSGLGTKHSNVK